MLDITAITASTADLDWPETIGAILGGFFLFGLVYGTIEWFFKKSTKRQREAVVVALGAILVVASIVYSPQRIKSEGYDPLPGNPYSQFVPAVERVEYALIWQAPEHSSLDLGRLAVTWVGIAVVVAASVYGVASWGGGKETG